jgi:uroporphyrinogen-III synthase
MTGPLVGVRVVVTRPRGQEEGLVRGFREAGARVEWVGLMEVVGGNEVELRRVAGAIDGFAWIAFTSANAVGPLLELLPQGLPAGVEVAVVGEATARAVRARGVEPSLVARERSGQGLAREMAGRGDLRGVPVLLPRAGDARRELAQGLRAAGAEVAAVVAYEKRLPAAAAGRVRELFPPGEPLGWVTFTSPRSARTLAELVDRQAGGWESRRSTLRAASIGPTTSAALRRLGVEPAAEAATPADEALVRAVARAAG